MNSAAGTSAETGRRLLSRRRLLGAGAAGLLGLGAFSVIACGEDEATPTAAPTATATPAGTTSPVVTPVTTATAAPTSAALATAFETPALTPAPVQGGTLLWGMESEIDSIDPSQQFLWVAWRVVYQMFEGFVHRDLLTEDPVPKLVGRLNKSWENPDDLTYIFHLQQNVKFHDGTPFDSAAAKFNYQRVADPDFPHFNSIANGLTQRYIYQFTERVETPDPSTITYINNKPYADFIEVQSADLFNGQVSPKSVETYGNDVLAQEKAVGTGPYRFIERVQGQHITMEKNPDYWGMPGNVDRVIWKPIPDNAARVTALQTGEVDLIVVPPVDSIEQLRSQGFQVLTGPAPHVWYMYFNMHQDDKLMQDIRVRKALQLAINKQGIAHELMKDTVFPAHQLHTPGAPAYDPTFKLYDYNPAEAKKLLEAAGYGAGVSTHWEFPAGGSGMLEPIAIAEWMQRDLKEIGFNIDMAFSEWVTFLSKLYTAFPFDPRTSAWAVSWGGSWNYFLNVLAHSQWISPEFPNFWYKGPAFDAALDKAQAEPDPVARNELYKEANRLLMEDAVLLPVVHDLAPIALSPKVHGFIHAAAECYDVRPIWIET